MTKTKMSGVVVLLAVVVVTFSSVVIAVADWSPDQNNEFCMVCGSPLANHGQCGCPKNPHVGAHNGGEHVTCSLAWEGENAPSCAGCATVGGCGWPSDSGLCFGSVTTEKGYAPPTTSCGCVYTGVPHGNCIQNSGYGYGWRVARQKWNQYHTIPLGVLWDHHKQYWNSGMPGQWAIHSGVCNSKHRVFDEARMENVLAGWCEMAPSHVHIGMGGYHNPVCGTELSPSWEP